MSGKDFFNSGTDEQLSIKRSARSAVPWRFIRRVIVYRRVLVYFGHR
jgi:hypothetical protein